MTYISALTRSIRTNKHILQTLLIRHFSPSTIQFLTDPSSSPSPQDNQQNTLHKRSQSSLVPIITPPPPSIFSHISTIVAHAIHSTVMFVANLKRLNVNEQYVKKVLREQVGMDSIDVDIIAMNYPHVLQASVRHNIEPVVSCLRSFGLTGTVLAHFVAHSPTILLQDVDERVLPLCQFLVDYGGRRQGMGVLLRHPAIIDIHPAVLKNTADVLLDALQKHRIDGNDDDRIEIDNTNNYYNNGVSLLLLTLPSVYCDVSKRLIMNDTRGNRVQDAASSLSYATLEERSRQLLDGIAHALKRGIESRKGNRYSKELEEELRMLLKDNNNT